MEVKCHRTLGLGVFKILNKQNLAFTEEIFRRTKWLTHRPNNIQVNVHNTAKCGGKSIWNSLPEHIKTETNFIKFKKL